MHPSIFLRPFAIAVAVLVMMAHASMAEANELDLRSFSFEGNSTYSIKAPYRFWWNDLVDPVRIQKGTAPPPTDVVMMPRYWTEYVLEGKNLPAKGCATYAINILLPDDSIYGLYLDQMLCAYTLYINGKFAASNGEVSKDLSKMKNEFRPQTVYFTPEKGRATLVFHISNRDYRVGGMWQPVIIGRDNAVVAHQAGIITIELFLFGAILIIGLYNIALYIFRTKDRAPLWFGLFCLIVCLRVLSTGSVQLVHFFPGISWELVVKLELSIFYIGSMFFALFFHEIYPEEVQMKHLRIVLGVFLLFTLAALVTPVSFFNRLVPHMQAAVLIGLLYLLCCLIIVVVRKRLHINYFLAGFIIFTLAAVNDILYSKGILPTMYILPVGLFLFIFSQAIAIARIFSFSFLQVELLSENLSNLNASLERFVPHEFLAFLGKQSITDVQLGDQTLKDITVLFADIRSFTTLSEKMTPEQTFKFLNSYLNRIGPIIRARNGFIDKYIGDAIMALFPNSPKDALDAAIEMVHRIKEYNEERKSYGLDPISIGIGIHTGSSILGIIGETMRIESTVISDAVNLSSRIENLTKSFHTTILVSGEVYEKVADLPEYAFRFIGNVVVKGKSKACKVYEVLSVYPENVLPFFSSTEILFQKAIGLYNKKRHSEALKVFQEILAVNSHDRMTENFIEELTTKAVKEE